MSAEACCAAIDELLPPFWSRGNPVDLAATVSDGVPERIIEMVAACDGVDSVITLTLIGSPSSGRAGLDAGAQGETSTKTGAVSAGDPADASAELNERERSFLAHIAAVTERTGKPIVRVPLVPLRRCVFPEISGHAPILLPSPTAAVTALSRTTWYALHPLRASGAA